MNCEVCEIEGTDNIENHTTQYHARICLADVIEAQKKWDRYHGAQNTIAKNFLKEIEKFEKLTGDYQ